MTVAELIERLRKLLPFAEVEITVPAPGDDAYTVVENGTVEIRGE